MKLCLRGRKQQGSEEMHDLYCSLNIVWVIKSRIMRWAGHVARMGSRGMCTEFQ